MAICSGWRLNLGKIGTVLGERTPTRQSLADKLEPLGRTRPRQRRLVVKHGYVFRALLFTSLAKKRRQTMASKLHLRQDIDIADVLARRHLEVAGTKPSQSLHRTVAVRSGAIPELAHIRAAHKVTGALRLWPSAPSSPRTSPPPQQRAFPFKSWNRNSSAAHGPSSRMTCSS